MDGIEERSQAFLRKVEDSENGVLDFYRYAHCFALDCASHFLLGTAGTKSIEEKAGMEIMEEMTYHSSLRKTQIAAEILDHLAAGLDTTGASLTYLLHTLSLPSNLPIQEKLHLSLTSPPKNTTQSETPYLNALITETLRLHPPIPMSKPRLTSPSPSKPRIIAQYLIPPNSTPGVSIAIPRSSGMMPRCSVQNDGLGMKRE
ncbi:hypothetical protein BPOR_0063g00080 [Botrytis porri]|uniref:Cytochrome P450 n=1 Tax=Botrytis porri TaxID=87229 RepID=A0A4Z1L192_9HELO|nr:hypothetical protein BPOR_0063g00080 [Botrytis porri]